MLGRTSNSSMCVVAFGLGIVIVSCFFCSPCCRLFFSWQAGDRTPLHWAALGSPLRILKSIVRRGGRDLVSRQDCTGYTALMIASEHNRTAAARFLVEAGSPLATENRLGHSAHELADWYGNQVILKILAQESAAGEPGAQAGSSGEGGHRRKDTTGSQGDDEGTMAEGGSGR